MLPLVRPSLAAVFVLTMVASWNAFFLPLLVLNDEGALHAAALGIMQYQGQYSLRLGQGAGVCFPGPVAHGHLLPAGREADRRGPDCRRSERLKSCS